MLFRRQGCRNTFCADTVKNLIFHFSRDSFIHTYIGLQVNSAAFAYYLSNIWGTCQSHILESIDAIEDYLEDLSRDARIPEWMRRLVRSLSRTIGETGDLLAFR